MIRKRKLHMIYPRRDLRSVKGQETVLEKEERKQDKKKRKNEEGGKRESKRKEGIGRLRDKYNKAKECSKKKNIKGKIRYHKICTREIKEQKDKRRLRECNTGGK